MSKRRPTHASPRIPLETPTEPTGSGSHAGGLLYGHLPSPAAIRETIESIVVAFVLAFLFRTFEAEAFVIPTGSMAPTLMGRHKDLCCPKCGFEYQVSASDEVDADGAARGIYSQTVAGTCPMCRFTADLAPNNPQHINYPSYSGDRILVEKFAYDLAAPRRWDVLVFKFPGDPVTDARTNFIKRLIGLPGETIRLQYGDVWVRREDGEFQIARKPPDKLLAMLQPVFDNDYMPQIAQLGWPARWQAEPTADHSSAGGWTSDDHAAHETDGTAEDARWLRYSHLVPSYNQWQKLLRDGQPPPLKPQLITDFTAYNTARPRGAQYSAPEADSLGLYWVGDLALECTAEIKSNQGELIFELRKGGRRFWCRLDVATGKVTLTISGRDMEHFHPTAATTAVGSGRRRFIFSNCDNELRLWIDGRPVEFDSTTTYDELDNRLPDKDDFAPVGVASVKAAVKLSGLVIKRDVFYIAELTAADHRRMAADPRLAFDDLGDEKSLFRRLARQAEFTLRDDQFFVLGDNSQRSKDGRLWGDNNHWVPRELLIGKALFIYWPHSWNRVPYVNLPFPFFPNFARMGLVR